MDFFDIGPGELLLILIVALIVWGPERLAEIGKTVGKTVHAFRKSAADLTTQVTREIEEAKKDVSLEGDEKDATQKGVALIEGGGVKDGARPEINAAKEATVSPSGNADKVQP